MTALADESRRDWMLVLAGYAEPLKKMMELNPGLASRIPEVNYYEFEDFSESELIEIADRYLAKMKMEIAEDAKTELDRVISEAYHNRDRSFGNARFVMNLIQMCVFPAMAKRVMTMESPSGSDLAIIRKEDIRQLPAKGISGNRTIGFR